MCLVVSNEHDVVGSCPDKLLATQIWEPTYARIVQETEAGNGGVKVNEIWGFESVHHGDSALVNAGKLGIVGM